MYDFDYVRPATLAEACACFERSFEPRWLAGGHSLIPALKQRLLAPGTLIDVRHLPELQGLTLEGDRLWIGAATRHAQVAASGAVAQAVPGLARLAGMIGDPQVRHMGTLGGSLAHADPAADYPAAVLACDARLCTPTRQLQADGFFRGMFETALEPGELLVKVGLRVPRQSGYAKFRNPASGYAVVGVFVARHADGVRVGVTGAASCAWRWTQAEQALEDSFCPQRASALTLSSENLQSDLHASAAYRAALAPVLLAQAVAQAMADAPELTPSSHAPGDDPCALPSVG